MIAPSPTEVERLAQLQRYDILDTAPEDVFDDFTILAAQICGTPISLISLLDANRQWFKSRVGLDATETPRELAFCDHAIRTPEVMEVPDATLDPRFVDNPLVTGAPDIRFYAGSPLVAPDGSRIGTLCVIDRVPRHLSDAQRAALARLGRQIIVQLELRLVRRDLEGRIAGAERAETLMRETLARATAAERRTGLVNDLLSAVRELLTGHLVQNGRRATFARLLELLLEYTDSNYGFVAEVLHDPAGQPYLKTQAVTNIAWNDEMRAFYDKHHAQGLEFRNLQTLFGAALTTGQTVISNSPATDPRRGGLPPGHPPLNAFLGVPIRHGGEMVGMVGVANRPDGYDSAIVELLEPLFSAYATIIHDVRMADLREEAQLKIGRLNQELQDRADRLDQANQALGERDQLRQLALENASVRLQHLATMDAASDGLALLDGAGLYTYVNAAHATMFGFATSEELLGKNWRILYDDDELARIQTEVFPELVARRHWHGRARARRLDGTYFPEALTLTLTPNGGLICVCRDDTIAVESEQKIHALSRGLEARAQELTQVNRELSDFAHVVSHDLKAPLRGIGSLANWLQQDYADKLGPEGAEQLQMIGGRVARLSSLIDGILSYSRAGRTHRSQTIVSLDALVRGTLEMLAPPAHITVAVASALPHIRMDPTKAQQLFQNLLSNAVKYMDKPSGRVTVSCVAAEGFWHFSIADNGPGIEEKYFERVFQLFQTLAPRDEVESTGVGLAVVKKIVETEGGQIWIESVVGHGATFHFTLPREESA
jgi:PAS domain S-box-containing protein